MNINLETSSKKNYVYVYQNQKNNFPPDYQIKRISIKFIALPLTIYWWSKNFCLFIFCLFIYPKASFKLYPKTYSYHTPHYWTYHYHTYRRNHSPSHLKCWPTWILCYCNSISPSHQTTRGSPRTHWGVTRVVICSCCCRRCCRIISCSSTRSGWCYKK